MSEVLATIGNYTITDKDVEMFIRSLPQEQQMYASIPQFRDQVKDKLVEMTLFSVYGEELKLEETDAYKEAMASAKREILGQLCVGNLLQDIEVSEADMMDYFNNNKHQFAKGPEATASHILVDSEEKANDIKKEIEDGAKSFADAAREYSSCPSKQKGGSLGTFGRGQMVKEFDEAAFTGELQTILGPVKTQFGYHLIWIDKRTEGEEPDFEAVKETVKQQVTQFKEMKVYGEKLDELKAKYLK